MSDDRTTRQCERDMGNVVHGCCTLCHATPDEPCRLHPTKREERLEEALWRIAQWADAYPYEVFPEVDAEYHSRARKALEADGMTLDRLSASAMRHVVQGVGKIAKEALR